METNSWGSELKRLDAYCNGIGMKSGVETLLFMWRNDREKLGDWLQKAGYPLLAGGLARLYKQYLDLD